ncbi:MAG TPA: NADH-quinone oxidoreductase subunit NuoE [Dehalococcoidales bacterium]
MTTKQVKVREQLSLAVIDAIVYKHNVHPGAMIAILQEIQEIYGYLPRAAILRVSEDTNVPASDIFGIVTFYAQFRLEPQGETTIKVCHGTACHLNGAERVADSLCKCVGAKEGETSADGKYTVEKVACLGCCSLAPTIMIGNETYGRLTPENVRKVIQDFETEKM